MIFRIPKGQHYAWPPVMALFFGSKLVRDIEFNISAKYDMGTEDNKDVNKLFGFGFFPSHHNESARFGWNYNADVNGINIFYYCYISGKRVFRQLCTIPLYTKVRMSIDRIDNVYSFTVTDPKNEWFVYGGIDVSFTHKKKIGYRLSCFFGGNNPAPHDITIKISKK